MRIAALQHAYESTHEKTIQKTLSMIESIAKEVDLVVLQELHQGEYFCQTEDVRFFSYAENFNNDVAFWASVAKKNSIVLVTSLFEKRTDGLYHNTAVVFDSDGSVAGKYRKMHIPDDPGFYEKFYFTPGDMGFEPIPTSLGKLGVLVCWDQWYPEAARLMTLRGAEILIYPTAIGWDRRDSKEEQLRQKEAWVTIQRSHAVANGIPVVACNRIGFEEDVSQCSVGIEFWGNSFICGSQGEIVAELAQEEGILQAEISKQRVSEVRNIWPFLRDRRIENYEGLTKRYLD